MSQSPFQHDTWYRAVSLSERITTRRADTHKPSAGVVHAELAERRARRWRAQSPFTIDSYFSKRLALDGVSEEEFLSLLGEPSEAIADRFADPPGWLAELAEAFADFDPSASLPEHWRRHTTAGFLSLIAPLLDQGRDRLRQGIEELVQDDAELPFDLGTIDALLFAELPKQLLPWLSRTMALELNVARLQGLLQGDSAEERFQSFLRRIQQRDNALALLQEYPVLARQLVQCIDRWAATSLEFLERLYSDWNAIRATFSPQRDPGVLTRIAGGMGDQHRGGRTVLIAQFSSGLKVVYKPRSLAIDRHVQALLAWMNEWGATPPFRTLQVLDRGSHGWAEFVSARGCASPEEVQRFYERQGSYLALLYILGATDFHHENLIADGEHPMLIDLETLFQPSPAKIDRLRNLVYWISDYYRRACGRTTPPMVWT
jgi:hypothetical protein